jgi:hypothetical protein
MKKLIALLAIVTLILSCTNKRKEPEAGIRINTIIDSSLVTDSAWGLITAKTNYDSLLVLFGAANVKDERICGPECIDSIDVTKVYPGTPKEITVYWRDSLYHKAIVYLENWEPGSPYHTRTGLKISSTLKEMLAINGQRITFSGFGWDYGGYVQSYNGGTMDKSPVGFRLNLVDNFSDSLMGDTELTTDMPSVKKVLDKIVVYQLSLSLYKDPEYEH